MTLLDSALLRVLALLGAALLYSEAAAQQTTPRELTEADVAALQMKGYALGDVPLGAADAPVTIIEYSSFTCPHCANFHSRTLPQIKEKYIDTGKVKLIFREVYFDQLGLWASMLARCGGSESFFEKSTTLFEQQQQWARAENVGAELFRIGRVAGLSQERVQACLTDEALMLKLVGDFQAHMAQDDVNSTPTFFINGEKVSGDMSVDAFSALIDKHL